MINQPVRIMRVKETVLPNFSRRTETFTTVGKITDVREDADGTITSICVMGTRTETGTYVHAWYLVCPWECAHDSAARIRRVHPCGLGGSLNRSQTITLTDCGCDVAAQCAHVGARV